MQGKEMKTELSEPEKEEEIEVATRSPSVVSCASGEEAVPERKVIRFEDGDGENPNNCMYSLYVTISGISE
jgi:hypothetical protein